jgi:hypothetical protein
MQTTYRVAQLSRGKWSQALFFRLCHYKIGSQVYHFTKVEYLTACKTRDNGTLAAGLFFKCRPERRPCQPEQE